MKFAHICIALALLTSASLVVAKDAVQLPLRKPLTSGAKIPDREPKESSDQWQPYFRWHRDAIAERNRDDNSNPANRVPAFQL